MLPRKGYFRRLGLALAVAVCVTIAAAAALARAVDTIGEADRAHSYENLLRLHVVAHSDEPEEQEAKLKVRDAILAELSRWEEPPDRDALARWFGEREGALIKAAEEALIEAGRPHRVRIEVGPAPFSQRSLGGLTFPAGVYHAVKVIIGDGEGRNWWCVLFPPLCFVEQEGAPLTIGNDAVDNDANDAHLAEPAEDAAPIRWTLRLWERIDESTYATRMREWLHVAFGGETPPETALPE